MITCSRIARVFPRKTAMTPTDELSFFTRPMFGAAMPEFNEVHISVTFTYDMKEAEWLYHQWEAVGVPVKIGGPAFKQKSGQFIPNLHVKNGCTFTSRGCPNNCWFCSVPEREGHELREYEIVPGYNIMDDNLLACSDHHIKSVFEMLKKQNKKPEFSGGLEAKLLKPWHAELLKSVEPRRMYFAYDTVDDLEPLIEAGKTLKNAGFETSMKNHSTCCYVLIGYPNDTFEKAETRLNQTIKAGFFPYAMLYRNEKNETAQEWRTFQREWCRPLIVGAKIKLMKVGE